MIIQREGIFNSMGKMASMPYTEKNDVAWVVTL
jgi:hypothetical protein